MLRSDFPCSRVLPPRIFVSSAFFFNSTKTLEINGHHRSHLPREFFLVQLLKSSTSSSSLLSGQQAHALAIKSGLDNSNVFVGNALINLYSKLNLSDAAYNLFNSSLNRDVASYNIILSMNVKKGHLDFARKLFDEMPRRDCVSFTTMIMGFCQNDLPVDSLSLFSDMLVTGVSPNEVTLASVLAACSHLKEIETGMGIHGLSLKRGFYSHVLVSTNLVHLYSVCLRLSDSEAIFGEMMEKNVVTWNAMLNGYAKSGYVDQARDLFERIPERDLVSWSTMIDGYLKVDNFEEALFMFVEMLTNLDARVNEVLLVDLLLACGRFSAIHEGRQLHGMILKAGLDSHGFVQATLIHFYFACQQINFACSQFYSGRKDNISSWNAMIAGFLKNKMDDEARKYFDEMPVRDVVSWTTLIGGYVHCGKHNLALDLFQEMQNAGFRANEITLISILSAIANSGTIEQGKWINKYICENSISLTDNLSAGLIDMHSKHGNIKHALKLFDYVKSKSTTISPWNAIICGLAMHGIMDAALQTFEELEKTGIRPNSITFVGVLSACCHAGLVSSGKNHFERMQNVYKIMPTIKHYGCMVDLLSRAGLLDEAERLAEDMPMEADVMIWGSIVAASRIHGNVEVGERAAENLAQLEPRHGANKVLLSNIYADAARWDDVVVVRRDMQSMRVCRMPGCSEILQ